MFTKIDMSEKIKMSEKSDLSEKIDEYKLSQIQPSQFYISSEKLSQIEKWYGRCERMHQS